VLHPALDARGGRIRKPAAAVCSGGEQRLLKITASLADGIPVDLQDTLTGLDDDNIARLVTAILHASGRLPMNRRY
jgi:hypothetical protein